MGLDPALFARPAAPRVSIALVIVTTLGVVAVSEVQSYTATLAALIAAAVTWRIGPLIGGIVTGAVCAGVVMFDPNLPHPMASSLLAWVISMVFLAMITGMVARRDSARAEASAARGPARGARERETPVRPGRPVTGDHARVRPAGELSRGRGLSETPVPRASGAPAKRVELAGQDKHVARLEHDVIRRFLRDIRDALGADEVALWQHSEDTDQVTPFAAAVRETGALDLETKPPVDTLVHSAVLGGTATNYDNEPNYFIAIPAGAEGRFHGALGVYAANRQTFARDRAKQSLRGFGETLAQLLHLLHDGRETRRYQGKAEEVADAVEKIQKHQASGPLAAEICRAAQQVSGASAAALVFWNADTETGVVAHMEPRGVAPPVVSRDSLAGMVCRPMATPVLRENFRSAGIPLFSANEPGARPGSAAAVPLVKDDDVVGAIVVMGDEPAQITAVETALLKPLAKFAHTAVKAVRELELRKGQATRDALTGLANRHAFDDRMKSLMAASDRFGQKTSLILADVDNFKGVNDTFGHEAGDEVLKAVAKAFQAGVRDMDMCARYGGEELAVVLPQTDGKRAVEVADRLRRAVEEMRVKLNDGRTIQVTVSFGVASHPDSVFGQEGLFKAADDALYAAKHEGKNCVKYATPKVDAA